VTLNRENWFFCPNCEQVAYKFDCCGNTSCNGGGCDLCNEIWDEVWRLIRIGAAPQLEAATC
jgi:hypothetical protein